MSIENLLLKYKDAYENNIMRPFQTDLYQMLVYAMRFRCDTVLLFYPKFQRRNEWSENEETVSYKIANGNDTVRLTLMEIDIAQRNIIK